MYRYYRYGMDKYNSTEMVENVHTTVIPSMLKIGFLRPADKLGIIVILWKLIILTIVIVKVTLT